MKFAKNKRLLQIFLFVSHSTSFQQPYFFFYSVCNVISNRDDNIQLYACQPFLANLREFPVATYSPIIFVAKPASEDSLQRGARNSSKMSDNLGAKASSRAAWDGELFEVGSFVIRACLAKLLGWEAACGA